MREAKPLAWLFPILITRSTVREVRQRVCTFGFRVALGGTGESEGYFVLGLRERETNGGLAVGASAALRVEGLGTGPEEASVSWRTCVSCK